jgi:hypothetical protein
MTSPGFHLRVSLVLAIAPAFGATLSAQDSTQTHSMRQRAWLGGALGFGAVHVPDGTGGTGFAGVLSVNYSPGWLVFEGRGGGDGQFWGDHIEERSALVGLRTPGSGGPWVAAAGYGRAHYTNDGGSRHSVLAYELSKETDAKLIAMGDQP